MKKIKNANFKLLKPLANHKKGEKFDCFGGLVSGVEGISFTNKEYFKICNIEYY